MKDDVCRNYNYLLKFPHGPFRHLKVMEKLARCKYCNSLLCCIEHRINHEKNHSLESISRCLEGRNRSSGEDTNREWLLLNEANLTLPVKQVTFPLVCVYCKLFIASEDHLTSVLLSGPQCLSKDCHWIVSWKKIVKLCKKENLKVDTNLRVSESCEVKICQDISTSFDFKKCTPVLHQNSALQKFKNLNIYTPEEQIFPPLEFQCNFHEKSLLKQTLLFTSTPQDYLYNCEEMALTPKSHDMGGILKQNEDGKPAGLLNHSVTFSPDVQIIHFSSDVHRYSISVDKDLGSGDKDSSGDEQFLSTCEKKLKSREKLVQCNLYGIDRESCIDSLGASKSGVLIHEINIGMQSGSSDWEGCERDKEQDIILKIESQVEGTTFPCERSDQISEIEKRADDDGSCDAYLEHKSETNDNEQSIIDNSTNESQSEYYSGNDESQSKFYSDDESQSHSDYYGNQSKLNPSNDENQCELNFEENQQKYEASESVQTGMDILPSSIAPVGVDSMRSQLLTQIRAILPDYVECTNTVSNENLTICEKNLPSLKKIQELNVFCFNNEKPIAVTSGVNHKKEREDSSRDDIVVEENEVDHEVGSEEQKCRGSCCSGELSVDKAVETRSEIECSSTTRCNNYKYVFDNADVCGLPFPQTYRIDHCNDSEEKLINNQPTHAISNDLEKSFVNCNMSNGISSIESSPTSMGLQLANLTKEVMYNAFSTDSIDVECSSTSMCYDNNNNSIYADAGSTTDSQTPRIVHCNDSVEKLIDDYPTSSVSNCLEKSIDLQNVSDEILNIPASNILQHTSPTEDFNSFSSTGSIGGFFRGESSFQKFASSLSSSWFVAKEFLSKSLRRKRQGKDISDDEPDGKIPKKKIKLTHPVHCCCTQSEFKSLPVHWKCHLVPESVNEYKIRGRRPLSRMTKHSD